MELSCKLTRVRYAVRGRIRRLLRRRRADRPRPSDAARTGGQIASSRSPTVPRSSRSASTAAVVSRVSVKGVGARFPAVPLAVGSRVGEDGEVLFVVGARPLDQPDANAVVGTPRRSAPGSAARRSRCAFRRTRRSGRAHLRLVEARLSDILLFPDGVGGSWSTDRFAASSVASVFCCSSEDIIRSPRRRCRCRDLACTAPAGASGARRSPCRRISRSRWARRSPVRRRTRAESRG